MCIIQYHSTGENCDAHARTYIRQKLIVYGLTVDYFSKLRGLMYMYLRCALNPCSCTCIIIIIISIPHNNLHHKFQEIKFSNSCHRETSSPKFVPGGDRWSLGHTSHQTRPLPRNHRLKMELIPVCDIQYTSQVIPQSYVHRFRLQNIASA